MKIHTSKHTHPLSAKEINLFKIHCQQGMEIGISNLGAAITFIRIPDRNGHKADVAAGFPDLQDYVSKNAPYFGVCVGRYANRIAGGRFAINGETYTLPINSNGNHIHGGPGGFHTRIWDYELRKHPDYAELILSYLSPHLEEGYPGNLKVQITYTIYEHNELRIDYHATTDQATHVNLTNHTYFNLSGFAKSINHHCLQLHSDSFLELDTAFIPTGKLLSCKKEQLDFIRSQELKALGIPHERELDHCFVLSTDRSTEEAAAILSDPPSGRVLKVYTSQPGIQVYSSNFLDGSLEGHNGVLYQKHHALCLETQHFPNSPNQKGFPSTLLVPGEEYRHFCRYAF